MNVLLDLTPRQIRTLETALRTYGNRKSDFLQAEVVELLSEIATAKTNRAA